MLLSSEESFPLNCIYIRTFALYIQFWRACIRRFHSLYFVYSIQGQIFCSVVPHLCYFAAFPLPFCVLVCVSAISLWPLCFFAPCFTWWVEHPFGLMYVLRPSPFVSLFLFPHINRPPHPPVRCLFPCHSAVIPRFCAGSAFPRSSGRALRFVLTITAIHWSLKPLNHPYKARPAAISNFPGREYCIHSRIFSFFCSHHKDTFALLIAFSLIIYGLILHIFSPSLFVLYVNRIFL